VSLLATIVPVQAIALLLVALGGAAVALTRELRRQAVLLSLYGFTLVILFLVFQAPDVALSELVVGAVAFPLVLVLALIRERR
jgi:energy-converting hydrogenase B subunit D